MIMKTLDKVIVDMSDPAFPYILQPIAEDRLKKMHSKQLNSFSCG